MTRWLACAALLALAGGAAAQDRPTDGRPGGEARGGAGRMGYANPSAAIAAELAFARLVQEKGQWTAFRAMAAPDAAMVVPQLVLAQAWLKDRANPPVGIAWQPYQVWASCDGSTMVTSGAWQRAGTQGWFTTVWQRQPKGEYKWVFDHGDATRAPLDAPEMIAARTAECPARRPRPAGPPPGGQGRKPPKPAKAPPVPFDPARREGRSDDGTLTWQVTVDAAGARHFTARMMTGGRMEDIRDERVAGG